MTTTTAPTVVQHVLARLADLGISDIFGVPGDYSFSISDAVCTSSRQRWVGCSNELNAAYAADGYARIKGMAALCTTYGVGELSALNGIGVGSPFTDFNSGAFTARLDPNRIIYMGHHRTKVGSLEFPNVELKELLAELAKRVEKRTWPTIPYESMKPSPTPPEDSPITAEHLYPRWSAFIRDNDLVVAETGTVSMGLGFSPLPGGATFYNQTLWGSIGWATPAAFGVSVAAPDRRVLLFTGEGSHQLTVQELGQFGRLGLHPIIFVLNNNGYLIERLLCKDPDIAYNDVAPWNYTELPHAMGCEGWFTAKVTTCQELDTALSAASSCTTGAYIEVVTDTYASSELALRLSDALKSMRKNE